jgi:hypothetical protein
MADLLELRSAIETAWSDARNVNICLFGRIDGWFRSGNILVSSKGLASVSYAHQGLEEALQEICRIQFEKILVLALLDTENTVDDGGTNTISVHDLLLKLVPYVSPVVIEQVQHETDPGSVEVATLFQEAKEVPVEDSDFSVEHAREMLNSCKVILEKYYGSGADKKVHEISLVHSPIHKPKDFLDQCMDLLAVMAGSEKATKIFKPLYEKIS